MNFQVPQFIDEKPHLIGPLSFAQFGYLIGAGLIGFILFQFFTPLVAGPLSAVVGGVGLALALGKVNGVSVVVVLGGALQYLWRPRVYTWQRTFAERTLDASGVEKVEAARKRMAVEEKLKAMAESVMTGKLFAPKLAPPPQAERLQVVSYLTGEKRMAKRIDYR